jgi:hypothetical protein
VLSAIRHTRVLAQFALLVMLGSVPVAVTALVTDDGDDVICQPSLVLHDHNAHRMGGARTASTPDHQHCAVCHWLQSLQTTAPSAAVGSPATSCHQLAVSDLPLSLATAASLLAARAPPASL